MKKTLTLTALFLLATPAWAQGDFVQYGTPETGPYLNVGVTHVRLKDLCEYTAGSCKDDAVGFEFGGGYRINPNVALEGGFLYAKGFDKTVNNIKTENSLRAFLLGGRLSAPLSKNFSIYAKGGMHFWEYKEASYNPDGTDPYFGAGAELLLAENVSVRGEYTYYKINDDNANTFGLKLSILF